MEQYGIGEHFAQFISTSADVKTVKRLLLMIRDLDFTDSPEDRMVADMFSAYLSNDTGWDGLSKSASGNAELMSLLAINDNTKSIYDCVCGYGISLAAASRKAPEAKVYGQDIIQNCVMISAMPTLIRKWFSSMRQQVLIASLTVKEKPGVH